MPSGAAVPCDGIHQFCRCDASHAFGIAIRTVGNRTILSSQAGSALNELVRDMRD